MKRRTITCLVVIGLAGMTFAFGDLLIPQENVLFEATERPREFSQLVTSGNFSIWVLRGFLGVLMEMVGTVGLYMYLQKTKAERLAFYGLLATLTHHILGFGVFTVAYFLFPLVGQQYLQGNTGAISSAAIQGPLAVLFALSLIFTLAGLAIMATAVYKSNALPKWSGWIAFLGFFLIPFPGVLLQFLTNMLWGFAYLWMAYHIYKMRFEHEQALVQQPLKNSLLYAAKL